MTQPLPESATVRVRIVTFGIAAGALLVALSLLMPSTATAQSPPASAGPVAAKAKFKKNNSFKVRRKHFGIHSFTTKPGVSAGTIRLNGSPTWREVQPKKDTWRWDLMDYSINRARQWGFRDLSFVFFGTPAWAGRNVKKPSREVVGRRSTSPPTKMKYWKTYIRRVVKRYGSKISSYQVWNEATTDQFYQGSAKRMAQMTKAAKVIIDKYDPSATVIAASVQTHRQDWFDAFAPKYFKELRKRGWPVDVLAGHFYPPNDKDVETRLRQIAMFNRAADRAGAPRRLQRWDTEVNYHLGSHASTGMDERGRIRGGKAATWVARTYLDSWRMGLRQTYWYFWTDRYNNFPGIQMYAAGQPGVVAYNTLAAWTVGTRFKGCTTKRGLAKCTFKKGKKTFRIVWAESGKKTYRFKGKKQVCKVDGSKCQVKKRKVVVRSMPMRVA